MKILVSFLMLSVWLLASVNINTASVKELTSLKGVGIKKAEMIVEYRERFKGFKTINQLTKVKGIGKKIVESNKDNISL